MCNSCVTNVLLELGMWRINPSLCTKYVCDIVRNLRIASVVTALIFEVKSEKLRVDKFV